MTQSPLRLAGTSLEPLLFWKKNHSLAEAVDFASSTAATIARLGSGAFVAHIGTRPAKLFELYDREGCPSCRKVREALSILDLNAIVHPCPEGGTRFRARVIERVGKISVPLLVDPNGGTEVQLTDSDAIVRHLFSRYGDGKVPLALRAGALTDRTSRVASLLRRSKGQHALASKTPDQLLELYSYEASPYCRLVREVLSQLELPYVLHNVARGSPKRAAFIERAGKMQVPYLVDQVHGIAMFESRAIVKYLEDRYRDVGDSDLPPGRPGPIPLQ
ncbi:MAG: glutathione S-transferase N-terminal domain-containing protein [Myxococcota bacterium]|nr:glutathione S-transferase N-terminal domain-containing protein [Myxococcota bacterium]